MLTCEYKIVCADIVMPTTRLVISTHKLTQEDPLENTYLEYPYMIPSSLKGRQHIILVHEQMILDMEVCLDAGVLF